MTSLYAPYPPYDGGTIRTFELLRALPDKHVVTYLSTYDPEKISESELRSHLSPFCRNVVLVPSDIKVIPWSHHWLLRDIITYPPTGIVKHIPVNYINELNILLKQKYDVILCNSILSGQSLQWADLSVNMTTPKILDTVDIFDLMYVREYKAEASRGLIKLWKYANWRKIAHYERNLWKFFAGIIAISPSDKDTLQKTFPEKPVICLPTGIQFPTNEFECREKDTDVLLVGRLDYPPNIDAITYFDEHILPLLTQQRPDIRVAIVGKSPGETIRALSKRTRNYRLCSDVPSVSEFYRRSKVAAVPIISGSGIKVKLLEALAHHCPVVTTTMGAYGIPVQDGRDVLIGDAPQIFADHILNLLANPSQCSNLAENGWKVVQQHYDWQEIRAHYLAFIDDVTEHHRAIRAS